MLYLLAPFVLLRLAWRGLRAPAYWRRWGERFGYYARLDLRGSLWVHAVSVGEVIAAEPLIRALRAAHPQAPLLVTTMTPTGSAQVRRLFGDTVQHVYAPYDLPGAVRRFLDRARPRLALIMETELWPNLFHGCRVRNIPVVIANARLSARSAGGYRRLAALTRATLRDVTMIAAQSEADAQRFLALGADRKSVPVTGSIKFDLRLQDDLPAQAQALREALGRERPVWVAGSTHEGEEEQVLEAFAHVRTRRPQALLLLVPRHPERFARATALCVGHGLSVMTRSSGQVCTPQTAVYLGDTMGELPLFYAAADIAFIGGSLVPHGGHNPLEAAALGVPVLFGPHMFNFTEIARLLLEQDAARRVPDAAALADQLVALFDDPAQRRALGERGRQVVAANRGALERLLHLVAAQLAGS